MSAQDWLHVEQRYGRGDLSGWIRPREEAVEAYAEKFGTFGTVGADLLRVAAPPKDCDLLAMMLAVLDELGLPWTWPHQRRGSCVGTNSSFVITANAAVDHACGRDELKSLPSVGAAYAGGKTDIGGDVGQLNSDRGDGSNGVWMAKWFTQFGVATRADCGLREDDYAGDEMLGVKWAASRAGVPAEIEAKAKASPVLKGVLAEDSEQVRIALQAGYASAECSGIIPSMQVNGNGVSTGESGGGHCMGVFGYRKSDDTFLMAQSWSDRKSTAYVWRPVIDRILRQRDTYIYAGIGGQFSLRDRGFWLLDHSGRPEEVFRANG